MPPPSCYHPALDAQFGTPYPRSASFETDSDGGAEGIEVGPQDEEIDVDEWRSAFPNDPDDRTSLDPTRGTPYLTRKDWLDLHFDRK